MKRLVKLVCIMLAISLGTAVVPVSASTQGNERASLFFLEYSVYLDRTTTNHFGIYYDVTATGTMDELGVKEIILYRSSDGVNWEVACTYKSTIFTSMIDKNTGSHVGSFIYCGTVGYYYQAEAKLYAKDSRGTGTITVYTKILQL